MIYLQTRAYIFHLTVKRWPDTGKWRGFPHLASRGHPGTGRTGARSRGPGRLQTADPAAQGSPRARPGLGQHEPAPQPSAPDEAAVSGSRQAPSFSRVVWKMKLLGWENKTAMAVGPGTGVAGPQLSAASGRGPHLPRMSWPSPRRGPGPGLGSSPRPEVDPLFHQAWGSPRGHQTVCPLRGLGVREPQRPKGQRGFKS